jgi:hypothetical protein
VDGLQTLRALFSQRQVASDCVSSNISPFPAYLAAYRDAETTGNCYFHEILTGNPYVRKHHLDNRICRQRLNNHQALERCLCVCVELRAVVSHAKCSAGFHPESANHGTANLLNLIPEVRAPGIPEAPRFPMPPLN